MSRANDEYNYVKIANNEEGLSSEYGSTPEDESASYVDNHDQIHDEVNDNPSSNDENKTSKKKERRKEQKENSANSSKGSGSAGGVSAASAAVVAAVCVVTGIVSIGAGPNTDPELSNLKLTPHETSVECVFDIATDDSNLRYKVELYNDDIDHHFEENCQIGHNELEFSDLESSTEYTFELFRGSLNEQNQEYSYESIYLEIVTTLELTGPATLSFNPNGRDGTMSSLELERGSEYTLPVSIFVPFDDEIFGGWKINGEGDKLQPGETIVVKKDISLVASWDKLPTEPNNVKNKNLFRLFPSQPSSEITTISNVMDIDFNVQNVYCDSSSGDLHFTNDGGFVSTTRPFGGVISEIEITASSAQGGDVSYTMVYSASPIYEKTTESGETHTISAGSSYIFACTNPDARYFCLSLSNNNIEPSIDIISFTYNIPVMDKTFIVSLDANGGSGTCEPQEITENKGELPTIEKVGFTAPDGYTFAGWKVDGVEDILKPGTPIGISCDITLIAQWEPTE